MQDWNSDNCGITIPESPLKLVGGTIHTDETQNEEYLRAQADAVNISKYTCIAVR